MKTTFCVLVLLVAIFSCSKESNVLPTVNNLQLVSPLGFRIAEDGNDLKSKIESNALNAFGKKPFTVTSIEYTEVKDQTAALVQFKSVDNDFGSVLLISGRIKQSAGARIANGGGTKVDCSGKCDEPTETCRERVTISGGTITYECTCQGGCSMTIEQTDN